MAAATESNKSGREFFEKMMAHDEYDDGTRFAFAKSGLCKEVDTFQEMLDSVTMYSKSERGMCFIENASPNVVNTLKNKYNIPDEFFAAHARTCTILEAWQQRQPEFQLATDKWVSLQGVYIQTGLPGDILICESKQNYWYRKVHDERSKKSSRYSNTTRISYCTLGETGWYLFLVDFNQSYFPKEYAAQGRVRIRFPALSNYSGGLQLLLHPSEDNLFDVLINCFHHLWTTALMTQTGMPIQPDIFGYMLVTSTNDDRLTKLRREIRTISFHAIRQPDISITDELHDAREEMALVKDAIKETAKYQPYRFDDVQGLQPRIENLSVDAEDLHQFFTETLQLIAQMNIIRDAQNSAQQARESLKQTKQAMLLTGLAAVYLPLSLATGIYGMNVQEINDSGHSIWYFFVTMLALFLVTFCTLVFARWLQIRYESPKPKKEADNQPGLGRRQSVLRIDTDIVEKPWLQKVSTVKSLLPGRNRR